MIGSLVVKLGTVITLPDVALAELTASHVDFVWIDLEHGALDRGDVQPLAIAARSAGAESFVRLASSRDPALGPVLDSGVDGVVVPRMERAEEAELFVHRLRYPPRGSRGVAARRASAYGRRATPQAPRCVMQIESERGVAEADRIATVEGVEALVVGTADLAAETGDPVGGDSPRLREAVERVRSASSAAGIAFGLAGPDDPRVMAELLADPPDTAHGWAGGSPASSAAAPSDLAVLAADVRIYARALDQLFGGARGGSNVESEAHVCA